MPGACAAFRSPVAADGTGGVTFPEGDASGDAVGCALDGEEGVGCIHVLW